MDPNGRGGSQTSELWAEHCMETSAGQSLVAKDGGNGYAPERGTPMMMMMTKACRRSTVINYGVMRK